MGCDYNGKWNVIIHDVPETNFLEESIHESPNKDKVNVNYFFYNFFFVDYKGISLGERKLAPS